MVRRFVMVRRWRGCWKEGERPRRLFGTCVSVHSASMVYQRHERIRTSSLHSLGLVCYGMPSPTRRFPYDVPVLTGPSAVPLSCPWILCGPYLHHFKLRFKVTFLVAPIFRRLASSPSAPESGRQHSWPGTPSFYRPYLFRASQTIAAEIRAAHPPCSSRTS